VDMRRSLLELVEPSEDWLAVPLPRVKAIAGVLSAASRDGFRCRKALRDSWFPTSEEEIEGLSRRTGVVTRFVVGMSHLEGFQKILDNEEKDYGRMVLPQVRDKFHNRVLKLRRFMQWAAANNDFQYLLKAASPP